MARDRNARRSTSRILGDAAHADPLYHARNLLWFAWPALPLIAWMLWTRGRGFNGGLAQPSVQIPGVLALVIS